MNDGGRSTQAGHGVRATQAGHGVRATQAGPGVRATQAGPGDEELVRAARAGDTGALDTLLRRHHPRLLALCRRLTGDPTDAEDACQEALVAVARGLGRFDGRSAFTTWAYRVTTNTCLDELRRRRRRPVPGLGPAEEAAAARPSAASDPGDRVAVRLDVDAALAAIPPDFRTAVVLRDLCQLSYDEIAAVLDVPVGTVRSRIARGRAALLPLLSGTPFGHGAGTPFGHGAGTPFGPGAGTPFGHGAGNPSPPADRRTT
ncbi:MAG TPA: RNA polymerase sigma factor [Acidimicrobiales bacterium]|nr:RNA polymerase sigma factor [Acidimicrobiales bacterium]